MKTINFYYILKAITENLEAFFIKSLKVFLKSKTGGWLFYKLIDVAVESLDERVIDPLIDSLVIRATRKLDIHKAKKVSEKLEQAKREIDEDAYYRHLNNLAGGL